MADDFRNRQAECSSLMPILFASVTKATHQMYSMFPPFGRLGRSTRDLLQSLVSLKEFRAGNLARSMLIIIFSVLAILLSYAGLSMDKTIAGKLNQLTHQTGEQQEKDNYSDEDLLNLPEPVQRFFRYALKPGQPRVTQCKLRQTGEFRLRAGPGMKSSDGWKRVEASETFLGKRPGFVWVATIQLAPFVWLRGWDSYVDSKGHMFWKLLSALTLVNFGGPEIDRGGLARYLSETVFFPTALLPSKSLRWEHVGVDSARAVLSHGGKTASAVFHFNELGQITRLQSTDRPRQLDDGSSTEDLWTGYYRDYRMSAGMNIPHHMEAVWNLMSGDCRYAKLQLVKHECLVESRSHTGNNSRRTSLGRRLA